MSTIKRYRVFLVTAIAIILVGFAILIKESRTDSELKSDNNTTFFIASDLHYLSDNLTDHGEAYKKYVSSGDGKQLEYIDEIVDAFAYDIKKSMPDFLIISGDLTNNGEKESHLELSEKLKKIEESGTSVYVIPGNHDILNPYARGFKEDKQYVTESISDTDFNNIYSDFGYEEALLKDTDSLSYLASPTEKLWLLMLDTNKYKNNLALGYPEPDGILVKSTLDWINKCGDLAREKGATIITVMHHNILNHSEVIQEGFTLNNSDQALIKLKNNQINLVFSGHIHVQDISSDHKGKEPFYDIASGALSVYLHQYGILKYDTSEGSLDYSTSTVDVERWSKRKLIFDKNLTNFRKYSEDFFGKIAYDKVYKRLSEDNNYSEDEIKLMSETMKLLNLRYFSGTENLNDKDVINSAGYKLWSTSSDNFFKKYILSISNDKDTDDNNLQIKIHTQSSEISSEN